MHQDFVAKNPHDKQLKQTSKEQLLENRLDNDHILAAAWTNHAWKYGQSQLALSVVEEWQKNCLPMAYQLQLARQIDPPPPSASAKIYRSSKFPKLQQARRNT